MAGVCSFIGTPRCSDVGQLSRRSHPKYPRGRADCPRRIAGGRRTPASRGNSNRRSVDRRDHLSGLHSFTQSDRSTTRCGSPSGRLHPGAVKRQPSALQAFGWAARHPLLPPRIRYVFNRNPPQHDRDSGRLDGKRSGAPRSYLSITMTENLKDVFGAPHQIVQISCMDLVPDRWPPTPCPPSCSPNPAA